MAVLTTERVLIWIERAIPAYYRTLSMRKGVQLVGAKYHTTGIIPHTADALKSVLGNAISRRLVFGARAHTFCAYFWRLNTGASIDCT